jgi:16S rRNA (cytosine1402-N4)-methyltransferase
MAEYHVPVLLHTVCTLLEVRPGKRYIDATLGGGGLASEIIRRGGEVLGLDQDPDALSACPDLDRLIKVRSNFTRLAETAGRYGWHQVAGVLFDLGVSSHQLATGRRGFSFQSEGPLDMRMDPESAVTAADLVNRLDAKDLARIFSDFGEVRGAQAVSRRLVGARPIRTTTDLAGLIPKVQVRQVFQALRIAVNGELDALAAALPQALSVTGPGGKILVISFHSLEDRIVKREFTAWEKQHLGRILTRHPIIPDAEEKAANPRSKSAKLRAFQKYV